MFLTPEERARVEFLRQFVENSALGFTIQEREERLSLNHSAVRKRRIRQATPSWADRKAIEKLYLQARAKRRKTKRLHHVDHIVPLVGRTVCGLHVETNLRIIAADVNVRRKRIWSPV